jgi:hypothetical protein
MKKKSFLKMIDDLLNAWEEQKKLQNEIKWDLIKEDKKAEAAYHAGLQVGAINAFNSISEIKKKFLELCSQ